MASSRVTAWAALRESVAPAQHHAAARDGVLDAAHDQLLAQLGGAGIAKGNDFIEVVPGIDMHQRKGKASRPEGLFRQPQQHHGILAAGKQQHRLGALGGHLAQDKNGLGFQPIQMAALGN